MRLLRLWWGMFLLALQRDAAHRTNLVFQGLVTIAGTVAGLFALDVVYDYVQTLAGWQLGEAIVLLGAFQCVTGMLDAFVQPNLMWFSNKVTGGELDDALLRPVPSLFMVTLGTSEPWALAQTVAGLGLIGLGVANLQGQITIASALAALLLLASGAVIGWATRVLLASLAFWSPGIDPTVLYSAFWQLGRYPISIYQPWVRRLLTYAIPVALIATIPARTLTRGADYALVFGGLAAALIAVVCTRWIWNLGLRRYTGATS